MSTSSQQDSKQTTASQPLGGSQPSGSWKEESFQNVNTNQPSTSQSSARDVETSQAREVGREAESSQLRKSQQTNQQNLPSLTPRVDVYENASGITLKADLPGVSKDKLSLRIEGETLQIEGDITPDTPENMEAFYAEVQAAQYRRTFTLSRELDSTKIEANFKDGVLTLRIPKKEHAQPRKIQVQAG